MGEYRVLLKDAPTSENPSLAGGCQLMSEAVHDECQIEKLGCCIAIALEEQFIAAGWPTGQLFGSEQALCRKFGVSRRVMREAVRVLSMRGTARLRRGTHAGLEVLTPNLELIVDVLRGYAYLNNVTEENRVEALAFLDRVGRRVTNVPYAGRTTLALDFLSHFMREQLMPGMPPTGIAKEKLRKVRAGRIAIKIMDQFFGPSFEPGRRIGSEADLSAHFDCDRSITRQAIRLLESAGLVTSKPGRGNGLITRLPPSGPVCRLICCYFASQQLPVSVAFELFRAMSVEAVALAASKVNAEDFRRLEQTLASNWQPGRSAKLIDIFFTEDSQFEAVRNPLIDLCMRSVRGYVALTVAEGGIAMPSEMASCFADNTRLVLDAIARREPEAAALAQEQKLHAMHELDRRHNPKVAGILYAG